ncbi:MAG TPA: protein translocase subunit SecF [Elusimicrobia bacterium]|nr:protein translocase subunit SecF [Elusimicrobiota bacterium]
MEIFHQRTQIDFIGNRYRYFTLSGTLLLLAALSLALRGINYGIEFTGGSVVQITYTQSETLESVRDRIAKLGYADAGLQQFTGTDTFSIRLKTEGEGSAQAMDVFLEKLQEAAPDNKIRVDAKDYVGPMVGKHLFRQAMFAVIFSLLGIVVYVAFRFQNFIWGIAGILALTHDVIILLGLYSFLRCEFNLTLVAALLTLAGYSINDTIVILDRMREKMRIFRRESLGSVINTSINETLSRTVITVLTLLIAVGTLWGIGGPVIHDFAMGMTLGCILGTFSSIAIAAPLIYQFEVGHGDRATEGSTTAAVLPSQPTVQPEQPAKLSRAERRRRKG